MAQRNNGSALKEAEVLINGPRANAYGPAHISFSRIAILASAQTGKLLSPRDIAKILQAVKTSRQRSKPAYDNLVDLAAYAELERQLERDGVADLTGPQLVEWLIENADIKNV